MEERGRDEKETRLEGGETSERFHESTIAPTFENKGQKGRPQQNTQHTLDTISGTGMHTCECRVYTKHTREGGAGGFGVGVM